MQASRRGRIPARAPAQRAGQRARNKRAIAALRQLLRGVPSKRQGCPSCLRGMVANPRCGFASGVLPSAKLHAEY
jgi:hypothetical protein